MPSSCPVKLAEQRERTLDRRKAISNACTAQLRARVAEWLATHAGPVARKVHAIAWWDDLANMTRSELHRETPEPPAELVRIALIECGYTPARAAARCVVPKRQARGTSGRNKNRSAKYAESSRWMRSQPIIEPATVHCRMPAASIGLRER